MRSIRRGYFIVAILTLVVGVAACSATNRTTSSGDSGSIAGKRFSNFLVIGVAHDYEGRAMFERKLARQLQAEGVSGTAYYSVIGGNKPVDRESIEKLVAAEGYDAVLISRVLNRESDASVKAGPAGAKATRKDGRPINLFRYDYEELNEPMMLNTNLSVSLSTELFETASKEMIWSLESTISDKDMLEELVDEASETIVRRLSRDRLIGR